MTAAGPWPFPGCYWADEGRLLAGRYPGAPDPATATAKLQGLVDAGVRSIVKLMEPDETDHQHNPFVPYEDEFADLAAQAGAQVVCQSFAVCDLGVPAPGTMDAIQQALVAGIASGGAVYVHCWGGRGRTGTAVGVYRILEGLSTPATFVEDLALLREPNGPDGQSPETSAQIAFVKSYCASEPVGSVP